MTNLEMFSQEYWDGRYGGERHVWSGRANAQLVAYASNLSPGRALDVGCGEGGDTIWLARRGWEVTGVDISPVGLSRAAANAQGAGVELTWRQADLFGEEWPALSGYQLVSSQYLHLPPELRERSLQRLAGTVAPGGDLLVVQHHPADLEIPGLRPNRPELFCGAPELAAVLDEREWEILATDAPARDATSHEGEPVVVHDAVLHARRRA